MLGFEGEYQSMRSAPCASAPSHPLHAMPPRITRNSDRPRASDRTMVDIRPACRVLQLELCHQQPRKLTRMDNNNKPNIFRATKQSGLDLEKEPRSSGDSFSRSSPLCFVIPEEVWRVVPFPYGYSAAGGKAGVCMTRQAGRMLTMVLSEARGLSLFLVIRGGIACNG